MFSGVTISINDFKLTEEELAEINFIDGWLKNSRKRLGPKIFGEPTND